MWVLEDDCQGAILIEFAADSVIQRSWQGKANGYSWTFEWRPFSNKFDPNGKPFKLGTLITPK